MTAPVWPWTTWTVPPEIAAALAVLLLAYLAALGPLRPREAEHEAIKRGQIIAFVSVLAMLILVLTGPLGELADTFLFSAHMVQHLVLTLGVAPLLLYSAAPWMLRPFVRPRPVLWAARFLTRPGIALATFTIVLGVWHIPVVYNLALESRTVHAVMHFTMVAAAIVNWWPLLSPLPEVPGLAPPLQILYVTVAGFPMVFVSALVTLSPEALYPHYAAAPRIWGISALEDQRTGGVLMWVPAHFVLVIPFTIAFFRWARLELGDEGRRRRTRAAARKGSRPMKRPDPPVPLWRRRHLRLLAAAVIVFGIVVGTVYQLGNYGDTRRAYGLAPESALSPRIQRASSEIRQAYRFALANREVLSRIPCFCGCGADGHTSNASCYIRSVRADGSVEFDNMSLG